MMERQTFEEMMELIKKFPTKKWVPTKVPYEEWEKSI